MKDLIISGVMLGAATLLIVAPSEGAQVFSPSTTADMAGLTRHTASTFAGQPGSILYVKDGTRHPPVALRSSQEVANLNIEDIAERNGEFSSLEVMRLKGLSDPLNSGILGKINFASPPASTPRKELLAIAWLFGIGLIGIATVGRRKKP
jgi:hypothetical protein